MNREVPSRPRRGSAILTLHVAFPLLLVRPNGIRAILWATHAESRMAEEPGVRIWDSVPFREGVAGR